MTRAKIRTFSQTAKFWSSEYKEMLAFHLLSREKIDRRANFSRKYLEVLLNIVTFATMNKKEKLIKRFRTLPRDFTFEEVVSLFHGYGFELENKGATSGSRIKFFNAEDQNAYIMHKPHPSNIIKGYIMRDILNFLIKNNYIK